MYDYDDLMAAAYAFWDLGLLDPDVYAEVTDLLDDLVEAKDERVRFE